MARPSRTTAIPVRKALKREPEAVRWIEGIEGVGEYNGEEDPEAVPDFVGEDNGGEDPRSRARMCR